MAHKFEASVLGNYGGALSVSISNTREEEKFSYHLQVPEGAQVLVISMTAGGPHGYREGPRSTQVRLTGPDGRDYTDAFTTRAGGQKILTQRAPKAGQWTLTFYTAPEASAEIAAVALKPGWRDYLNKGARWYACVTCKLALKAIVSTLLATVAPAAAAAPGIDAILEVLRQTAPELLDWLAELLGSRLALAGVIGRILEYLGEAYDEIVTAVCRELGLC